jgi:hypothetical protein
MLGCCCGSKRAGARRWLPRRDLQEKYGEITGFSQFKLAEIGNINVGNYFWGIFIIFGCAGKLAGSGCFRI